MRYIARYVELAYQRYISQNFRLGWRNHDIIWIFFLSLQGIDIKSYKKIYLALQIN